MRYCRHCGDDSSHREDAVARIDGARVLPITELGFKNEEEMFLYMCFESNDYGLPCDHPKVKNNRAAIMPAIKRAMSMLDLWARHDPRPCPCRY